MDEPLDAAEAKRLIVVCLSSGTVSFSKHAEHEMATDKFGAIDKIDVVNVLRGGIVSAAELEKGSWRYPVRTQRITVVIAFRSEMAIVVVTAWRNCP